MSSLLVFDKVYGLEIQSVMLVFSIPLVNYLLNESTKLLYIPNKTYEGSGRHSSDTCR